MAVAILKHAASKVNNLFLMPERKKTTEEDFVKGNYEPRLGVCTSPRHIWLLLIAKGPGQASPSLTVNEDTNPQVDAGCLRHHQPSQED